MIVEGLAHIFIAPNPRGAVTGLEIKAYGQTTIADVGHILCIPQL